MVEQLKKIAFLVPRSGMRVEAFGTYWRDVHGPLVAGSPGYGAYRRRYVQNHILGKGPIGSAFAYAGMAEFWLPGDNEEAFSSTPIYRDRIRVDEENFIDMNGTVSMTASEQIARHGAGPAKLVIVSSRAAGMPSALFRGETGTRLVDVALGEADFAARLVGWALNHVIEGSFRLPGARPIDSVAVDCVHELWFGSRADIDAAFAAPGFRTRIAPLLSRSTSAEGLSSFVAEELVFFDGVPIAATR